MVLVVEKVKATDRFSHRSAGEDWQQAQLPPVKQEMYVR